MRVQVSSRPPLYIEETSGKAMKVMLRPKNCDRCNGPLDKNNTFYIRIGNPPSKTICANCHDNFVLMMESLFSSRKITSGSDREGMQKAQVEWFNALVTQR